jgi:hypothetical protein
MKKEGRGSSFQLDCSEPQRALQTRFREVGVVSAILQNLARDLGLGIAVMTIVRGFSASHWARILQSF